MFQFIYILLKISVWKSQKHSHEAMHAAIVSSTLCLMLQTRGVGLGGGGGT